MFMNFVVTGRIFKNNPIKAVLDPPVSSKNVTMAIIAWKLIEFKIERLNVSQIGKGSNGVNRFGDVKIAQICHH